MPFSQFPRSASLVIRHISGLTLSGPAPAFGWPPSSWCCGVTLPCGLLVAVANEFSLVLPSMQLLPWLHSELRLHSRYLSTCPPTEAQPSASGPYLPGADHAVANSFLVDDFDLDAHTVGHLDVAQQHSLSIFLHVFPPCPTVLVFVNDAAPTQACMSETTVSFRPSFSHPFGN